MAFSTNFNGILRIALLLRLQYARQPHLTCRKHPLKQYTFQILAAILANYPMCLFLPQELRL